MASKETRTKGTSKMCPCPWCGQPNQNLDDIGEDENGRTLLRTGTILECDFCNNRYIMAACNEVISVIAERYGDMIHKDHLK